MLGILNHPVSLPISPARFGLWLPLPSTSTSGHRQYLLVF
ncbi:hypothetical protein ACPOL_2115 [Acidisarcina polymorpha]|uniref:Uncharacterized protein n=1 Tax=Acidisarcina polymorpha TaxID=2211140 RepID=A0A2Z5FX17_9BACT|nr:hypothetical protein ACPOL_2115 [Acidisarcina polymorpha]